MIKQTLYLYFFVALIELTPFACSAMQSLSKQKPSQRKSEYYCHTKKNPFVHHKWPGFSTLFEQIKQETQRENEAKAAQALMMLSQSKSSPTKQP